MLTILKRDCGGKIGRGKDTTTRKYLRGKKNRESKSGLKKEIQLLKWQSPKSRLYGIITTLFLSNVRKIETHEMLKLVTCYFGSVCHHNRNGWRYIHFYTASSSSMSLFLVLLMHLSVWCVEPTAGFLQPFLLVEQCTAKIFKNKTWIELNTVHFSESWKNDTKYLNGALENVTLSHRLLASEPSQSCCLFHAHDPTSAWNPNYFRQILCLLTAEGTRTISTHGLCQLHTTVSRG